MHPEFPQDDSIVYLNHAGVSPWPKRTRDAVARFAEENVRHGAAGYPRWLEVERELRGHLAWLLNAPSADDIALLKSTSEGLSLVAYGLDWRAGDNVVSFAEEFPSNRIVWESLAPLGVESRQVRLAGSRDPEGDLLAACDGRTRLVAVSSAQYSDGLRTDLPRVGAFCRRRGVLFCVDAIQTLGALPFDAQACEADFVAADGHKWMLGPEGLAVFWCRGELRERLRLLQYGWHMVEAAGDFTRHDWFPSTRATRFECGSPNMLGIHALNASLSLIREEGIDEVAGRISSNSLYIIKSITESGFELVSPVEPSRHAGIVTFRVPGADPAALHRRLMDQGVICAPRGGGIRFSPHFYLDEDQLARAFGILARILG